MAAPGLPQSGSFTQTRVLLYRTQGHCIADAKHLAHNRASRFAEIEEFTRLCLSATDPTLSCQVPCLRATRPYKLEIASEITSS
jgi:hypothetical protein